MALTLAPEPAFVLLRDLHDVSGGLLEGAEVGKRLHVLTEPQGHLQRLDLLAHVEQEGALSRRALARTISLSTRRVPSLRSALRAYVCARESSA